MPDNIEILLYFDNIILNNIIEFIIFLQVLR